MKELYPLQVVFDREDLLFLVEWLQDEKSTRDEVFTKFGRVKSEELFLKLGFNVATLDDEWKEFLKKNKEAQAKEKRIEVLAALLYTFLENHTEAGANNVCLDPTTKFSTTEFLKFFAKTNGEMKDYKIVAREMLPMLEQVFDETKSNDSK